MDIITLQARLEDNKRSQKALKQQLNAKKTELRNQAKVARKLAREGQPSFWTKCERAIDSVTLKLCQPFEKRAVDLRRKQENPEGYEADCTVDDISHIVAHMEKKRAKRTLKDSEIDILIRLDTALVTIMEKKLGTGVHAHLTIRNLLSRIEGLLPLEVIEQMAAIDLLGSTESPDELIGQFNECFQKLGLQADKA